MYPHTDVYTGGYSMSPSVTGGGGTAYYNENYADSFAETPQIVYDNTPSFSTGYPAGAVAVNKVL